MPLPLSLRRPAAALALGAAILTASTGVAAAKTTTPKRALFATMNGANVIAQDGVKGAGDRDGFGSFTAIRVGNRLCYALTLNNVDSPLGVRIYRGGPTANGPSNVGMRLPASGTPGTSSGCVAVLGSLLDRIFAKPADYYVNVQTDDFRDSAIRGQLHLSR
jgi:hypothetical protein